MSLKTIEDSETAEFPLFSLANGELLSTSK